MIPQRSASVGWQARMDWSEAERRPARRAGDQTETEGSWAVKPAQREHDNKELTKEAVL